MFFFISIWCHCFVTGQFTIIPDTTVCDFYVIPSHGGMGLSTNIRVYTNPFYEEPSYVAGDTLFESTQVFVFDAELGFDECYFLQVIDLRPMILLPDTLYGCDRVLLPQIVGEYISGGARYYTALDRQGEELLPGAPVLETMTLYAYDGTADCFDEQPIHISVRPRPYLAAVRDTFHCSGYTFPPIAGVNIPAEAFYMDASTQEVFLPGDVLDRSAVIYVIAQVPNACEALDSFSLVVHEQDFAFPFEELTACAGDTIDISEYGFLNRGILFQGGDTIRRGVFSTVRFRSSGTYCILDSVPGTDCVNRSCIEVTVLKNAKFYRTIDTLTICRNSTVELSWIKETHGFPILNSATAYDEESGEELNTVEATESSPEFISILYVTNNDEACMQDSSVVVLQVEECEDLDTLIIRVCNRSSVKDGVAGSYGYPVGSRLLNDQFQRKWEVGLLDQDSVFFYLLYERDGLPNDTVVGILYRFESIELGPPNISFGSTDLCLGGCLLFDYMEYFGNKGFYIWEFSHQIVVGDTLVELGKHFVLTERFITVCYELGPNQFDQNKITVGQPNIDHIFVLDDVQALDTFPCIRNNTPDTLYFTTKSDPVSYYQDVLCPEETVTLAGETFSTDRPAGTVRFQGASMDGCDSLLYVELTYLPPSQQIISRSFCDSTHFVSVDCNIYDYDSPRDTVVLQGLGSNGCDSIIIVDLAYYLPTTTSDTMSLCVGETADVYGQTVGADTTLYDTLYYSNACDSLYRSTTVRILDETPLWQPPVVYECTTGEFTLTMAEGAVLWSTGDSSTIVVVAGVDSLSYRYTDANGCPRSGEVELVPTAAVPLLLDGLTTACSDEDIFVDVVSPYEQLLLDELPVEHMDGLTTGEYKLTIVDSNGCIVDTTLTIEVVEEPTIELPNAVQSSVAETTTMPVSYGGDIVTYSWSPSTYLSCADCPFPSFTGTHTETYTVTVTNRLGCTTADTIEVSLTDEAFYLPNIVNRTSITSDNRVFSLISNTPLDYQLAVYDRWGGKVFDSPVWNSSDANAGWTPASELTQGVYVYRLSLFGIDTKSPIFGTLTIL